MVGEVAVVHPNDDVRKVADFSPQVIAILANGESVSISKTSTTD